MFIGKENALSSTGLFLCFSKELTSLGDKSTRVLEILHSRLLFYSWWVGLLLQASLFCWSGSWLLFGIFDCHSFKKDYSVKVLKAKVSSALL